MKPLRFLILSVAILAIAGLLSGCTGTTLPSGFPGATVVKNTAYLAYNQYVYAVDLSNGTQAWRYPDKGSTSETFFAAPSLTPDGQLIIGSYNNKLFSLDPANRTTKWEFTAKDRFVGSPLVTSQGIFAPSADNHLYALDFNGKELWTFTTQGPDWSTPTTNDQCGCIVLASMDRNLYSLNAKTGALLWKVNLGNAMVGTPAWGTDNNTLYIGNFGSEMIAINAQNGQIRWRTSLQGWTWGGPILDGDWLYFGDLKGNFYSLQATDGKIMWSINSDGPITATPLATPDAIYFATDAGSLYAINRDSTIKWTQAVGGKIYSSPILAGDKILVTPEGTDGVLMAYNTSGVQVWAKFVPPK
jgi:outer membrane protein assembly factor BamB